LDDRNAVVGADLHAVIFQGIEDPYRVGLIHEVIDLRFG
jgi:hypothetical protein